MTSLSSVAFHSALTSLSTTLVVGGVTEILGIPLFSESNLYSFLNIASTMPSIFSQPKPYYLFPPPCIYPHFPGTHSRTCDFTVHTCSYSLPVTSAELHQNLYLISFTRTFSLGVLAPEPTTTATCHP